MAMERVTVSVMIVFGLISMASAIPGTATFYTPPYTPSACYGPVDQGTMIAAANPSLFGNGAVCGRTYRIRCVSSITIVPSVCRSGVVTVRIVDLCPGCGPNHFDLSQEAFAVIANPDAGRVPIDYVQV